MRQCVCICVFKFMWCVYSQMLMYVFDKPDIDSVGKKVEVLVKMLRQWKINVRERGWRNLSIEMDRTVVMYVKKKLSFVPWLVPSWGRSTWIDAAADKACNSLQSWMTVSRSCTEWPIHSFAFINQGSSLLHIRLQQLVPPEPGREWEETKTPVAFIFPKIAAWPFSRG